MYKSNLREIYCDMGTSEWSFQPGPLLLRSHKVADFNFNVPSYAVRNDIAKIVTEISTRAFVPTPRVTSLIVHDDRRFLLR